MTNNASLWTYEARSQINPDTHLPYINGKYPKNYKKKILSKSAIKNSKLRRFRDSQ